YLLIESSKPHLHLYNLLVQLLDDGALTDSLGRKVDFKNTVIIMTSNLGTRLIKGASLGFQRDTSEDVNRRHKEDILGELKHTFSPEFLNRIDEVVVFHSLEKSHLVTIVDNLLAELNKRLSDRAIELEA